MTSIFKYSMLRLIRNKSNLFWILLFPILLGCMFKVAFSNIGKTESFQPIPVAIVCEDTKNADTFRTIADELGKEGKDQMLSVIYCEEEKALKLLEEKEIDGILYAGDTVKLTISANMGNARMNQSILKNFVEEYNVSTTIITDTLATHPEKLPALLKDITTPTEYCKEVSLSRTDADSYTQYFYNLIAMACLYTAMGGLFVAIENQANLSTLAARKNISPAKKQVTIIGELAATITFEFVLNLLAFLFLIFVLRVDMTARLPFALLAIFVSTMTGICLGFFLGSIGPKSEGGKIGMMFAIVMPCCFFSGLMMGNMRILVEQYAPFFNRINPAALMSDCFYSLATYDSMERYTRNILTLILLSFIFCLGGFLFTRRKKYASL